MNFDEFYRAYKSDAHDAEERMAEFDKRWVESESVTASNAERLKKQKEEEEANPHLKRSRIEHRAKSAGGKTLGEVASDIGQSFLPGRIVSIFEDEEGNIYTATDSSSDSNGLNFTIKIKKVG